MKKNNLKRFLASLLAVLMLSQVTGVAPGVFAEDAAAPELVETSKEQPKEVLIKSNFTNEQVLTALADTLLTNADAVDAQSLDWTYTCEGSGKYYYDQTTKLDKRTATNTADGSIFGFSSTKTGVAAKQLTWSGLKDVKIDVTCNHPALKANADGAYTLYLNDQPVYINKVAKYSSKIDVVDTTPEIAIPYNADGSVNNAKLHESIFKAAVTGTTPEGLTYDRLSYPDNFSEGEQTITISYAGDDNYYGTSKDVKVKFVDGRNVAFTAKDKPETLSIGYDGSLPNEEATLAKVREQLINKVGDVDLNQVKIEYNVAFGKYAKLDIAAVLGHVLVATDIKLTYAGDATHKPFTKIFENIKFADNRVASSIAIKEGASITFNMSADNMKQQIFDNVIDWDSENTKLPANGTLTIADFKFEIGSKDIADKDGYPNLDAGNGQTIKISFVGNSEFKPCNDVKATIDVAKADVKVTMKSFSTAHAGNDSELTRDKLNVKLDPNDSHIDTYLVFTGVNTDLQASVNLVLTDEQWKVIEKISNFQKGVFELAPDLFKDKTTLKDKLESGITIKEFKEYLNSFVNALEKATKVPIIGDGINDLITKYGISIETLKAMATIFDNLTKISDNTKIAMGAPEHAGIYQVWAIAINKNYNTGVASGTVMILMNVKDMKIQLNSNFSKKMTVAEAKALAEDPAGVATLLCGTKPVGNPNLHYLYTGVQSNLKPYSSTTDFPTAPGRYVVTIVTLGGDYLAPPVTKTFQITK